MVLIHRAAEIMQVKCSACSEKALGNASCHKKAVNLDAGMDSLGLNPGGAAHGSVTWAVI